MRLNARNNVGNKSFFSISKLAVFIIASVLLIFIVFPKRQLHHYFSKPFIVQPVTINYLNERLIELTGKGIDIDSDETKISHAKKSIIYQQMMDILDTKISDSESKRAHWLAYEVLRWIAFSYKPNEVERQKVELGLGAAIYNLDKDNLSIDQLQQLAHDAMSIQNSTLAFRLYQQILEKKSDKTITLYINAASTGYQSNNYLEAGNLYLKAFQLASNPSKKKDLFLWSIKSFQAGEHYDLVIKTLKAYDQLYFKDSEVLLFMSKAALGANAPALAKEYVHKLMILKQQ